VLIFIATPPGRASKYPWDGATGGISSSAASQI
jgi:hypothetical protein